MATQPPSSFLPVPPSPPRIRQVNCSMWAKAQPRGYAVTCERARIARPSSLVPPFLGLRKKSQSRSISRLINASLAHEIDGNLDSRLEGGNGMAAVSGAATRMTVHGHSRWHCWHGTSGHGSIQGEGKKRYTGHFCEEAWFQLWDCGMDVMLMGTFPDCNLATPSAGQSEFSGTARSPFLYLCPTPDTLMTLLSLPSGH